MEKKIIRLTENELHKIVEQTATQVIDTMTSSMPYQVNTQSGMITEMARINKNETGRSIFPYEAWEVKIWSSDHNQPHFHIIRDGWDVSFTIEDGDLLMVKSRGGNKSIYYYMCSNVKRWLSSICSAQRKLTNQENAMLQWEQLHDE
jgi:hypothetical protein